MMISLYQTPPRQAEKERDPMAITPLYTYELRSPTLGYEVVVLSIVDDGTAEARFTTSNIGFPPPPCWPDRDVSRVMFENILREGGWTIESRTPYTQQRQIAEAYDREHPIPLVPMASASAGMLKPGEEAYCDWADAREAKGRIGEANEQHAFLSGYQAALDGAAGRHELRPLAKVTLLREIPSTEPGIIPTEKGELLHGPWKDEGGLQLEIETGSDGQFDLYYAWPGDDWCRSSAGDPIQFALVREIVRLKAEATARAEGRAVADGK
jgi:hypothetical protein